MKRALFWSIGGLVVAAPFAMLHIKTGVIVTPQGDLSLADSWGAFLYAGAGLLLGFGHRHVVMLRFGGAPPTSTSGALAGVAALVYAYGSSSLLQAWPALALASYLVVWSAGVCLVDKRARGACVVQSIGAAFIACAFEVWLASTGAFRYGHPDVFGVAMWLPGIYLNAGLASHLVDRRIMRR